MKISPDWGSHMPVLMQVLERSTGPILELGTGLFSTPYLHWVSYLQRRELVSFDSEASYLKTFRGYRSDLHKIYHTEDWDTIDIDRHWSVALVDHAPAERRVKEIARLANNTDFVVIHDSDPAVAQHYHYDTVYPLYKYRFDFITGHPNTTVLSNTHDLSFLKL